MQLLRQLSAPIGVFLVFVVLAALGFATTQTGWVAVSIFCAWPLLWAVAAWTLRGLKDSYQLVPKQRPARGERRAPGAQESFN